MLLLLNRNLYKWRTTSSVCCFDFHRRGVFIGVQGGAADLVKSVTHHVVAGRHSHVVDQPWSSASTDLQLRIPLYRLLESVTAKPTHERLQGGAGQLGDLASRPPPGPTSQRPL
jgi:hypothetical protein